MPTRLVCVFAALLISAASAVPAFAQSSTNGVGGGYTGSDQWFKSQRDSAAQRGVIERNLGSVNAADGAGREIQLRIAFAKAQRGLGNVMHVLLVPETDGAREVLGLASFDKENNAVTTAFAPRKDVRPGTYAVMLVDARGGRTGPVGRIEVGFDPRQAFKIDAATIGQGASSPRSTSKDAASVAPKSSGDYQSPKAGDGYKRPSVGQGYVPPGTR